MKKPIDFLLIPNPIFSSDKNFNFHTAYHFELYFITETPGSRADKESDSVMDFFSVLFANPAAEPTGNALTGIQKKLKQ